jgi:hypothetical protein
LLLLCESGQWFQNVSKTGDKPPVVGTQAQEAPNFMLGSWGWPYLYNLQLAWVCGYSLWQQNMSHISYFLEIIELLWVELLVGVLKSLEHLL